MSAASDDARSPVAVVGSTSPLRLYRLAHNLWVTDHEFATRLVSRLCRHLTGVEIHPGADVGERLCTDREMVTVIGETSVVDDVTPGTTIVGNPAWPIVKKDDESDEAQSPAGVARTDTFMPRGPLAPRDD